MEVVKMTKNELRIRKLVNFFKYNNFSIKWISSSSVRMDRIKGNRWEIVYIPVSPLCRPYSEIHFLNKAS